MFAFVWFGLLASSGTWTTLASAQGSGVRLNQFRTAESVSDGFVVSRPDDRGHRVWDLQRVSDYAHDPLVFETRLGERESESAAVVAHHLHDVWHASLGAWDRVPWFAGLPSTLAMRGTDVPGLSTADGTGIGDPWLGARIRLLGGRGDPWAFALQGRMTAPLARLLRPSQAYTGERSVTMHPELLGEWRPHRRFWWTANLGVRLRQDVPVAPSLTVGDELSYALGCTVALVPDRLHGYVEAYGATGLRAWFRRQNSPVEALAGVKWRFRDMHIGGALGPGLSRGYGSPDLRAVLTLGFIPRPTAESSAAEANQRDRDEDGVVDVGDACPDDPEDRDGFADDDGCPEPDNDGDGLRDSVDHCPNKPGLQVDGGCPPSQRPRVLSVDGRRLRLDRIEFSLNGEGIKPESQRVLASIAETLRVHPEIARVRIEGHTDASGPAAYNKRLSQRRAEAVRQWLVEHGVEANRLLAVGCGERYPRSLNATETGRSSNRRTEFKVIGPDATPEEEKPCQPKR